MSMQSYDVIVIGAGHAGLEAAFACAKQHLKTAIFTVDKKSVALMPCNPSIGGPAKGIVTREIDALGGIQAIAADANALQFKLLNSSKGPGVWALRAQIDKDEYHDWFLKKIEDNKYLDLKIEEVKSLIIKNQKVAGVKTTRNNYHAKAVIITSGTYLSAKIHIGKEITSCGPFGLKSAIGLSDQLKELGFKIIRLKTGTPPRIDIDSFEKEKTQIEHGTEGNLSFSFYATKFHKFQDEYPCYLTYTNDKTHKIIKEHLYESAMYSHQINGVGPRYCPSIEDKIVRFSDKPRHQVFVEPVSKKSNLLYLQGLSTSLPKSVQLEFVHTIKGLEHAKFVHYAYAIEYDAIDPTQLWPTLESKLIKNCFFAGQINGTSGYEEAAGQGLIAGINASMIIKHKAPLILGRDQAYIGVMIDDIVTKGVNDPYRLLTSRAEHRLYLRNDNADERLIAIGKNLKMVSSSKYNKYLKQQATINSVIKYLKNTTLKSFPELKKHYKSHSLYDLLKQQNIQLKDLLKHSNFHHLDDEVINKITIKVKFAGYIEHEELNLKRINKNLEVDITSIDDYQKLSNLSLEAREKLNRIKPLTLRQASMIPGINLNDLMVVKYYIEHHK